MERNKSLTPLSRELRKNMTPQERKLWYEFLKTLRFPIKRQFVIGNYIVDFYCDKTKTVIELDGSQHYDDDGILADNVRTDYLNKCGITVLRYSNADINNNFDGVCEDILNHFGLLQE